MIQATTARTVTSPIWARESFVNAFWAATGETPEWIAARTDALPKEGYSIVRKGVGPAITAKVSIGAGSIGLGGRLPAHKLHIDLTETTLGGALQ